MLVSDLPIAALQLLIVMLAPDRTRETLYLTWSEMLALLTYGLGVSHHTALKHQDLCDIACELEQLGSRQKHSLAGSAFF